MKKLTIIIILILNFPIFAFSQGRRTESETLNFINKEQKFYVATSKVLKNNLFIEDFQKYVRDSTRYQSLSFGLGVTTFNYFELIDTKFVLSFGISHQFSKSFFLEGKFDYCPKTEKDEQIFIFSGIPQFAFNLSGEDLKLKTGLGLYLLGVPKNGALISVVVDAKVEYNLSKDISIYPEIRIIPVLLTFNVSYKIPLK